MCLLKMEPFPTTPFHYPLAVVGETEEGSVGMEVVRQGEEDRTPPFHHILSEQAKSLIALQELQNEVGALLEFREVVMEAFPQLRAKLRSSGSSRWEPGVRVKRKPRPEEPRSRSNSRSSKAASSVVADSGFCTKPTEPSEDELWTLLELIQSKGTRLRLEAETLRSRSLSDLSPDRLQALLQERERLLSQLSEMEAERAARLEETLRLSQRVEELTEEKQRLEAALASSTPRLGTLDGIVSSPAERIVCQGGVSPSKEVTAAILRETNVLELQRHLLTTSYENQVAGKRLERLTRIRETLTRQLDKYKEENEDLKFQLEEKSIELEGTRARVRLLERGHESRELDNSSTESAGQQSGETPKRPRSRIPLKATSVKPPRPIPNSQNRKPPAQGGLDHDSLESRELDRSMRSEIVLQPEIRQKPEPRQAKSVSATVRKKKEDESLPRYFDSIDSHQESDSLDMV
nr:uncharacterized protein LOC106692380 isoform X1 [Halyomorpha halys]